MPASGASSEKWPLLVVHGEIEVTSTGSIGQRPDLGRWGRLCHSRRADETEVSDGSIVPHDVQWEMGGWDTNLFYGCIARSEQMRQGEL